MVDALGFFFKKIDFWEGGIDIRKDGKGFFIFWYMRNGLMIRGFGK